jgi:hypothetical protein
MLTVWKIYFKVNNLFVYKCPLIKYCIFVFLSAVEFITAFIGSINFITVGNLW